MTFIEALVLGIVQGLTEFLPVSSSGHIELGSAMLNVQTEDNLLFSIIVHGATALSTIVIFRRDIGMIIKDILQFKWNDSTIFAAKIILSMIPVGIAGVFFEKEVEMLFTGNTDMVAIMLMVTGLLLSFTYFAKNSTGDVTFVKAFIIGIAQAIAIFPGISRSGATISTAIMLGVDKEKATRFSFLMVLIPIIGAMLLKFKDLISATNLGSEISIGVLSIGFLAAFISGLIACAWMIHLVKKGKLIYFAIYCIAVGSLVLIFN